MAGKIQTVLYLEVPAGKAQPAPPLGPMLGANGVNIGQFIKEFNEKTMDLMKEFGGADVKVKVILTVYIDRTFKLEIGSPVTSNLILWKL
jgi:large subunit ribosomal protein L11